MFKRILCTAAITCALVATNLFVPMSAARADAGADAAAFVAKINGLRASKGLAPLSYNANLTSIAYGWSAKMAAAGNISHNHGYASQVTENWQKLGENVGMGGDVNSLFAAFVASPSHYKNLIDPAFTYIGVGVVWSGTTMFTTHDFMQMRGATIPAAARAPRAPRAASTAAAAAPAPTTTTVPPVPTEANPLDVERAPERTMHSLTVLNELLDH